MIFQKQRKKLLLALAALRIKDALVRRWVDRVTATGQIRDTFLRDNGIPPESFSRWVNGVQEPGEDTIKQVEKVLENAGV